MRLQQETPQDAKVGEPLIVSSLIFDAVIGEALSTGCPWCQLRQFIGTTNLCRRCRKPLPITFFDISLSSIDTRSLSSLVGNTIRELRQRRGYPGDSEIVGRVTAVSMRIVASAFSPATAAASYCWSIATVSITHNSELNQEW
jgi:hypothetical protein